MKKSVNVDIYEDGSATTAFTGDVEFLAELLWEHGFRKTRPMRTGCYSFVIFWDSVHNFKSIRRLVREDEDV